MHRTKLGTYLYYLMINILSITLYSFKYMIIIKRFFVSSLHKIYNKVELFFKNFINGFCQLLAYKTNIEYM